MGMSKNWKPYFSQRVKNLFNSLTHWSDDADPSSLHDLRVEIKKWMAMIRFLRKIYPEQHLKKERNAVKRIFQELGQLREYHILETWLLQQKQDLIRNSCFPKEDVEALTRELVGKTNNYIKRLKQSRETLDELVSKTHDEKIEIYLSGLFAGIKTMRRKDLPESEWHTLRKNIKQYIYASNWLPAKGNPKTEKILNDFHALEEAIGKWHDMENIREALLKRQLFFSKEVSLQLCFTQASDQLKRAIQYRNRKVVALL